MALSLTDTNSLQAPFFSYAEGLVSLTETEKFSPPSYSNPISSDSQSKLLRGRRLFKETVRLINTISKTAFAFQQKSTRLQTIRHTLDLAKQGVAASKVIKTAFVVSREKQEIGWRAKAYNWANMIQSIIVGTIICAPLINSSYNQGKKTISICRLIRTGVKLAHQSESAEVSKLLPEDQKKIKILKICKSILSLASEAFILIGFIFGVMLLPKVVFLAISLAIVNLGVVKSFCKQALSPLDEFSSFP
jgi:hypothetical protein